MHFGLGLSTLRDPRRAAEDAAASAVAAAPGRRPSLVVLTASPEHADGADALLAAVHDAARPEALIGCVADGVVAGVRELEDGPSVAVWAAWLPDPVETFHMEFLRTPSGGLFAGYEFGHAGEDFHVLLPDPFSFPTDVLLDHLNEHRPGTRVLGGLVSGTRGPGECRLFLNKEILRSGAVGVRIPNWRGITVVSQGCRPVGEAYTVTEARGPVITGLGGRPPLHRLRETVAALPAADQDAVLRGPQIGILVDEYVDDPARGDFLIRPITGADQETGALHVGEVVEVGTTVEFQIRDATTADEDLRARLERALAEAPGTPAGALLFTCNGRGSRMFAEPDHDAALVADVLGAIPLAGFFAAGELGPVGGRTVLNGFTASLAVFVEP